MSEFYQNKVVGQLLIFRKFIKQPPYSIQQIIIKQLERKMLTLQELAIQIKNNIGSGIKEFQRFLSHKQIYDHQFILKAISDIIASDIFTHQQKQLASASLNFLLSKRLNENYQLYLYPCWQEYFRFFIQRQPGDQIEWKYLCQTIRALRYLIEQLSSQVAVKSIQKFRTTNFVGKVMLMHGFKDHEQVSSTNLYLFFSQTIDQFLSQVQSFLKEIHNVQSSNSNNLKGRQQIDINTILFEHDVIMAINEWLQFLAQSPGQGWKIKLDQLAMNNCLVNIIKEQMKLSMIKENDKYFYKISDETITFCDDLILKNMNINNNRHSQKIFQNIVQIKSYTLNILKQLVKTFSSMQGLQQFDNIPVLGLIEFLTPILLQFLHKNQPIKKIYVQSDDSNLTDYFTSLLTSIFQILNTSASFIFLMQSLSQFKQPVLYSIFTTYLQATKNQLQYYEDDESQFISISENFIQKQPNDKCQTPKQSCGNFMQSYLKLINTVQVQFMEFLSDSLKFYMNKEKSPLIKQIQSQGYKIPSIQTIYTILTRIYFFADKSNQYFLNFVYNNFINQQFVFQFKKIEKVRFLIFIQYSYGQYFKNKIQQGTKYIIFANETKDQTDIEFKLFLQFLEHTFIFGIAQNIWEYLINEIQLTQKRKILSLIHRLLQNHIRKIPIEKILILTQKIKNRIQKYIKENKQKLKQPEYSHDFLYKCFQIVQTLSQDKKLMLEEAQILGEIMQIIDFFNQNGLQNYEFSCQVIRIFNLVIEVQQVIPVQFEKYLSTMSKIVSNNKFYGPLLETYYLILLKGRQSFERKPQFLQAIKSSIEQKILSQPNRTQEIIIESTFLLQNIYLVYPKLIKQNRNLYDATFKIYQTEKQNTDSNTKVVASILLFWMAGEYAFGNYNLGSLNECRIQIFKEQFGLMFALNLRKLIEKYYDTQNLSYLLKLSLKILDYQHFYKNDKRYRGPIFTLPIFKKYLLLDSFQEINSAIQFLRQNLSKQKFAESLEILKNELGIQKVNELLKKRIFNFRTERNIVTIKRN